MIVVDGVKYKPIRLQFSAGFPVPDDLVWSFSGSSEDYECGFSITLPRLKSWKEIEALELNLHGKMHTCFFNSGAQEIDNGQLKIGKRVRNLFPVKMEFNGAGYLFSVNATVPFEFLALSFFNVGQDVPKIPVVGLEDVIHWQDFQDEPEKVDRVVKGENMGHWRFLPAID